MTRVLLLVLTGCDGAAAGLGLDPDRCGPEERDVEDAAADLDAAFQGYRVCTSDCDAARELWIAATVDHALTYADWSDCLERPL